MKSTGWLVIVCYSVLLCGSFPSTDAASDSNATEQQPLTGYGSEVILSKLDYIQYKLHEMELTMKEREEELTEKLTQLEQSFESMQWSVTRHDHNVAQNLTYLQTHAVKMVAQQTACANHEQMRKEIAQLTARFNLSANGTLLSTLQDPRRKAVYPSCTAVPGNVSGVYSLQPADQDAPFEAFCEQTSFGGGWLVIHYRFDGTLDFYRSWAEYRNGFGSVYQEFWIGLERLHQLTSQASYELLIEMKDFTGTYKYAKYDAFAIGSETDQYTLQKLGVYDGTAGDSLKHHAGAKFTTKDRDNDENGANCAATYEGAWWYRNCHASNLNGRYQNKDDAVSMCWHSYKNNYQGLAYVRMMIREL